MNSPVKRRILANLSPGDDVLVTFAPEAGRGIAGTVAEDQWGRLVLYPHPRVIRFCDGDGPTMLQSAEVIEAAS